MFERGEVYSYSYLWAREAAAGEESGRKNRPACLLIRPSRQPDLLFMFAITSREPRVGRIFEKVPTGECARCGLEEPAWIMLDEYNVAIETERHDFESLEPTGKFSSAFLGRIVRKVIEAAANDPARRVIRS